MAARKQFATVRQMIRDGKIDEARLMLITMRDDPQAVVWLDRLNQMAPPNTVDPTIMQSRAIAARIDMAMADRDRKERHRRRRGCLWRISSFALFLVCQCAWLIPLMSVLNNFLGVEGPDWLQDSIEMVSDNPVTGAVIDTVEDTVGEQISTFAEEAAEDVISQGAGQLMPLLSSVCETQGLSGQELALCRQMMDDIGDCVSRGGDLESCVMETLEDLCRQQVGNDPQMVELCMGQLDGITQYLP